MISLGPFGDTIYAPALPEIQQMLDTTYPNVQLTITSYLFGYAISQIMYGPLSDKFGRKPIMLMGAVFFILSSIICLMTDEISTLIWARLLQGFGAAAGGVIATVAVKDAFHLKKQGSIFAMMNIAFALAPAIGAILGIFIHAQAIFITLLGAATFLFLKVLLFFPETNKTPNKNALKPQIFAKNYITVLKDHQFLVATIVLGLNISIIYGCLIEAPKIFAALELEKITFLYLLVIIVLAVICGSLVCAILSRIIAYKFLIIFGLLCSLASGILLWFSFMDLEGITLLFVLSFIFSLTFVGVSFTVPLLTPIALENFTQTAGVASSTMGFMQMGLASLSTAIMSQVALANAQTLSLAFIILPAISLLIFVPYSCFFLKK